jgi:hypothetical protein
MNRAYIYSYDGLSTNATDDKKIGTDIRKEFIDTSLMVSRLQKLKIKETDQDLKRISKNYLTARTKS